ncbi:MAG TPA: hypothetical protein VGB91_06675 [Rhizomicrobium sp.]
MAIYSLYGRHGTGAQPLVMGIKPANPTTVVQCVPGAAAGALVWSFRDIPGTQHLFLKHEDSGLYAKFAERNGAITLAKLDPYDRLFALLLHDVGDGFVAIRNHEGALAMGARNGSQEDGTRILALPFGALPSLHWLFGPPTS